LYLEKGLVPLASELTIQSPAGLETIPAENISRIELPGATNNRVLYTMIGAILDALTIAAFIKIGNLNLFSQ
jgi:hypothetical protein